MPITQLKKRFLERAIDKLKDLYPKAKNVTFRVIRHHNGDYQVTGRARYVPKSFVAKKRSSSFSASVRLALAALMRQMERSSRRQFQLVAKSNY